ncbi:MAG: purine-binding chemotaxis protein CheW [Candidatus Omnitrophica bacterium]|nr:purine-binding chemotaxis protein CheW [Candidatus Omnitrophota bacterium]
MAEKEVVQQASADSLAQAGKYLTFAIGKEDYGIEILKVREIIGMMEVTTVPQVPEYVKGVINLRGKVIPVISLRLKFGMNEVENTEETCIIVVNIDEILIGIIIDKVNEVLDIEQEAIEPPPNFGSNVGTDFILGIGKVADSVKILLNIDKVLSEDMTLVGQGEEEESAK